MMGTLMMNSDGNDGVVVVINGNKNDGPRL